MQSAKISMASGEAPSVRPNFRLKSPVALQKLLGLEKVPLSDLNFALPNAAVPEHVTSSHCVKTSNLSKLLCVLLFLRIFTRLFLNVFYVFFFVRLV